MEEDILHSNLKEEVLNGNPKIFKAASMTLKIQDMELTVKTSKTDHAVPVVNDVHLHSIYNPIKEAESFVQSFEKTLKEKNLFLVLGLGFGYHILEMTRYFDSINKKDYKIAILEPNEKVYQECLKNTDFKDLNVSIFCSPSVEDLYANREMVEFLRMAPKIIPHAPSFNLYNTFFKSFMSFNAKNNIRAIEDVSESPFLRGYLDTKEDGEFDSLMSQIRMNSTLEDKMEYILLAYDQIGNLNNKGETL